MFPTKKNRGGVIFIHTSPRNNIEGSTAGDFFPVESEAQGAGITGTSQP